jgi:endonuclease/exonuclease/phosphatase family metal-dependent hydrolase
MELGESSFHLRKMRFSFRRNTRTLPWPSGKLHMFVDSPIFGFQWIFEKKVVGGSYRQLRLDKVMATIVWCARYPLVEVKHLLATSTSDHIPILLKFEPSN